MILRPYQADDALWLSQRTRAYLANEPRVGKTPTTAYALELAGATSVLVICPAKVKRHWMHTLAEIAPRVPADVRSYEAITYGGEGLRETILLNAPPSHLVLDEAHTLRNAGTQRTQLILGKGGYARAIPGVWALSGTPMWKHVGNLWTIVATLFPKEVRALGVRTVEQWYDMFARYTWEPQFKGPPKRKVWGLKSVDVLNGLLDSFMLRRRLTDTGMQVPPVSWSTLLIDAPKPVTTSLSFADMETALRSVKAWEHGGEEPNNDNRPLAVLRHELGDMKAPLVAEYVADELEGRTDFSVALFAYHHSVLEKLESLLRDFGVARVDGHTSEHEAWNQLASFQGGEARVFLGQNRAVREGVALDRADTAILVEPEWSAKANYQLSQRIVALGDPRPKLIQFAAVANSIDEAIERQHVRETEMQELVG